MGPHPHLPLPILLVLSTSIPFPPVLSDPLTRSSHPSSFVVPPLVSSCPGRLGVPVTTPASAYVHSPDLVPSVHVPLAAFVCSAPCHCVSHMCVLRIRSFSPLSFFAFVLQMLARGVSVSASVRLPSSTASASDTPCRAFAGRESLCSLANVAALCLRCTSGLPLRRSALGCDARRLPYLVSLRSLVVAL